IWLIVHAFIKNEVEALIAYAKEIALLENEKPFLVVITDQPVHGADFLSYSYFPASDWFPIADRIFTGGGFNVLKQGTAYSEKITAIPFPRKYDDQKWRVMNFRLKSKLQRHKVAKTN
ncbi:MAG: hypothetical protein OEU76_06440, partial [Cyclobacteriaceae bacterium]|nr:hypothetical protein [Cyclobacteriaceae bacterium]